MPQFHCPNQHHWSVPAPPAAHEPASRGACPVCGELVALDCRPFAPLWRSGLFVALIFALPLLAMAAVVFWIGFEFRLGDAGIIIAAAILSGTYVCFLTYFGWRSDRQRLRGIILAAGALGLRQEERLTAEQWRDVKRLLALADFCANPMLGEFHATAVMVFDLTCATSTPMSYRPTMPTQTAIVFPDRIVGLPDFELTASRDQSKFYNKDLLELIGLRKRKPGSNILFNQRYELTTSDPDAAEQLFDDELRDVLARQPGWVIQARAGQMLFFQPVQVCPASQYGVLLAIAWQLRERFATKARTPPR